MYNIFRTMVSKATIRLLVPMGYIQAYAVESSTENKILAGYWYSPA